MDRLLDNRAIVAEMNRTIAAGQQMRALAQQSGLSDRTLRRHLHGPTEFIRVDNADRIASALGLPLSFLYPGQ
jgi:lambda repressor-like predicted transcriptional regulator